MTSAAEGEEKEGVMEIWCAVVDDGSVFSVVVPESARVQELQKAIVSTQKDMEKVDSSDLKLSLSRKPSDSTWLKDSHELSTALVSGGLKDCLSPDLMLRPTRRLRSNKCFGKAPVPTDDRVHVLVRLPETKTERDERSARRQKLEDSWKWKVEAEPSYTITSGRMLFVNREAPTQQLLKIHWETYCRAISGGGAEWIVPLADNVPGLGKSMFAMHYIRKCRSLLKESECSRTWKDPEQRKAWETSEQYKFEKTLCDCHTVHVTLKPGSLAKTASFDAVVLERLLDELSEMFEHPPQTLRTWLSCMQRDPKFSAADASNFLQDLTRDVGSLFIAVDDIGQAFEDDSTDEAAKRARFFAFCEAIIISWLAIENIFFVLVGTAPFLRYGGLRPPGYNVSIQYKFERLDLQLLRPSEIKQIIMKTHMTDNADSKTIQDAYSLTETQVNDLAQYLAKVASGHPRALLTAFQLCGTLEELLGYTHVLPSME